MSIRIKVALSLVRFVCLPEFLLIINLSDRIDLHLINLRSYFVKSLYWKELRPPILDGGIVRRPISVRLPNYEQLLSRLGN